MDKFANNEDSAIVDLLQVQLSVRDKPTKVTKTSDFAFPDGRSADDLRSEILEKLKLLVPSGLLSAKTESPIIPIIASTSNKSGSSAEAEFGVATEKETTGGDAPPCPTEHELLKDAEEDTVRNPSDENVEPMEQNEGSDVQETISDALLIPGSEVRASTTSESVAGIDAEHTSEEKTTTILDGGMEVTANLQSVDVQVSASEEERQEDSLEEASDDDVVEEFEEQTETKLHDTEIKGHTATENDLKDEGISEEASNDKLVEDIEERTETKLHDTEIEGHTATEMKDEEISEEASDDKFVEDIEEQTGTKHHDTDIEGRTATENDLQVDEEVLEEASDDKLVEEIEEQTETKLHDTDVEGHTATENDSKDEGILEGNDVAGGQETSPPSGGEQSETEQDLDAKESHKPDSQSPTVAKQGLESRDQIVRDDLDASHDVETTSLDGRCENEHSEVDDITPLDAPTPYEEENAEAHRNVCSQDICENTSEQEKSNSPQSSIQVSTTGSTEVARRDDFGIVHSEESVGQGADSSDGSSSVAFESDTTLEQREVVSEDESQQADADVGSEEGDDEANVEVVSQAADDQPDVDAAKLEDCKPDVVGDHQPVTNVSKEKEHGKVANMDLWSASEIRKTPDAILEIPQTKFNFMAPKTWSSATLLGPSGINIRSLVSLAPHTTAVDFNVVTNNFQVTCDNRVAPVAKFLLDQLVITERILKDLPIHAKLDGHVRIYTAHSRVHLGQQFAEVGEFGFQFQKCWTSKLHCLAYRLSLYKASTIIDTKAQPPIGTSISRRGGDFHPPTEYAILKNCLQETCKKWVGIMRKTNYDVSSMKLVFELGDALFIPSARSGNKMPTMKSVNRNPALRNCDGIRIGHKDDVKLKFTELEPEVTASIIRGLPRKDPSAVSLELICNIFHPEHGTVQVVFDILPQTATLSHLHLSEVIRLSYTTHEAVVLCNAHPLTTRTTAQLFPVDYRWKVQVNVAVSSEIYREVSSYVQRWTWSEEAGIMTPRNLPNNGWIFKHVPKFPSFTIVQKTAHTLRKSRGLVSSSVQDGTVTVERRTEYHPPPPAFVYLYETNHLAHPSTFNLDEYELSTTTNIGGTCLHWDKNQDINEVIFDYGMWKEEIQRTEQLLETLVKG